MSFNISKLSYENCDNFVKVEKIENSDQEFIKKINNIGIFEGSTFFVKNIKLNKKMIHLIINDVEYALRLEDAKNILVRTYEEK